MNLSQVRLGRIAPHAGEVLNPDAGVRVTVNTDDPLMFGSDLSGEFLALYKSGVLTAAELDAVRLEGLR